MSGSAGPRPPSENPAPSERRFSDEEFAVILKRASELQVRTGDAAGEGGSAPRGLSLGEIRQIAAEAGIDPRFVDQAVAARPTVLRERDHVLVGAPFEWDYINTVPGRIPRSEVVRVLDALRSVMKQKGEIEDVYGSVEWHYDDTLGPVLVRLSGRDDHTRVEVSARRAGEVGLWYGVFVPIGGLIGGAALAGMLGVSGAAALAPVVGMSGLSWIGTRALWRRLSVRWEQKLATLAERVADAAGTVAQPPGDDEGHDPDSWI